ncbi:hypothetical protein [Mucilaginibacter gotjawali]|uniref:O-antigen ligase n=2 Tax=Mucilaginibacter gotjawali TaxID=1550579 RepID=A0A839SJL9_9SPHI|nr:hypothetical protein [Mucilaginibacter gotjawali]MBB3058531.1 O-antigen ligase [Mucilaginibacter gotjawali]BAU55755.1 hypothetical protein MgSA37_03947 [Mucilaginibacter gotjawali]
MKKDLENISITDNLILLIIVLIGFQQFPVIRIGGSFKLYELAALALLVIDFVYLKHFKFNSYTSIIAFGFFVVSPVLSYLYSVFFLDYPAGFYIYYPDADSFKFNYYVFPLLQLLYMFFNFCAINGIIGANFIYKNFDRVAKLIIITGTFISIYSLIAMSTVDVIGKLPQFIQNKSDFRFRSSGLSQEPSFYVLYQTWVCLFAVYSKHLFNKNIWRLILLINILSLITTFSTALVSLIAIIFLSAFFLKNSFKTRFSIFFLTGFFIATIIFAAFYFDLNDLLNGFFLNKIQNFFTSPDHTMDSGGFRSYTTGIGVKIFLSHPLTGVGVGNSVYYMYLFENKMGIISFGETLQPGSFPQNLFSIVLSEQGIIGGLLLLGFLLSCLRKFWHYRNYSKYNNMFLIGILFNITAMLSIAPQYSLFIWVFFALGLGYIKHINMGSIQNGGQQN